MTVAVPDPKAKQAPRPKTRLARLLLPQIDSHSALLPPDSWILKTARDFVKDNKSFHDTIGRAALYAGGGLLAVAVGITAVALLPLALPVAAATGLLALGAAGFTAMKAKFHAGRFKTETLPGLRAEIGKKYLDYKMSELKSAWQKNLDARRLKKAAEKKQAGPATPKPAPPANKTQLAARVPAVAKTPDAPQTNTAAKPEDKKSPGEKSFGGALGAWALKMAEERAKKLAQKTDSPPKPGDSKPAPQKPPQP